jgi:lipopolysaccharide heptosyltransferase II
MPEKLPLQRILIVEVNWAGDVLFSTPFIRCLKENYPQAYLACLAVPRVKEILQNNPYLDEVIVFDEQGRDKGFWSKIAIIAELKKRRFDSVFLLHRSTTRTFLCALAGIKRRIGYETGKFNPFLTQKVAHPDKPLHKVEYFLQLAQESGLKVSQHNYEFFFSEEDARYISAFLKNSGIDSQEKFCVINPGGNWDLKRWPKENFSRLAEKLQKELRLKVVITGAEKDSALAENISHSLSEKPIVSCGKTTLPQLAALLKRAALVISNDSGPMHIAVSVGTKTIAIFGPTSAQITGPYGTGEFAVLQKDIGCSVPCYNLICKDNRCMKAVTVEEVFEKAKEMLS